MFKYSNAFRKVLVFKRKNATVCTNEIKVLLVSVERN